MQPVYKKQKEADRGGVLRSSLFACRRCLSPSPVAVACRGARSVARTARNPHVVMTAFDAEQS